VPKTKSIESGGIYLTNIENDTERNTIHTLENDSFLQYIFTELVKVHVALTGEFPKSMLNFSETREEDEIHEQ